MASVADCASKVLPLQKEVEKGLVAVRTAIDRVRSESFEVLHTYREMAASIQERLDAATAMNAHLDETMIQLVALEKKMQSSKPIGDIVQAAIQASVSSEGKPTARL
jgi:hypothetical protein